MVNARAISHSVTSSEFLRAAIAAIAASEKSRMLNAGRTSPGSSKRIIRSAGAAISTLNSASRQNDSREGAFLFIQLALEAIILFPWQFALGYKDPSGVIEMPAEGRSDLSSGRDYRRRLCTSVMTPAPSTTITMTVASASAEARISYQLFQNSSMRWPLSRARPSLESNLSKGRASATKNAMLRFVARVLIARQHDLCRTGVEALPSDARKSSEGRLRSPAPSEVTRSVLQVRDLQALNVFSAMTRRGSERPSSMASSWKCG